MAVRDNVSQRSLTKIFHGANGVILLMYLMNYWMRDFTYKIHLGPGIFILAIVVSVAIAWLTVGYKAIQAALANPVNSLRSE